MGNGEIKTQFTSKADGKCVHTTCIMCVTKETTQQIQVNAGPNTITVKTTTQDGWYHQDAYFRVRFQEASCDVDCSGCELTGSGGLIEVSASSDEPDIIFVPTVDDDLFPPIGPAECPYDILLLKHNGVTTYPENSIRILSQDETTVTVELLQLFTPAPTDVPEFAISAGATCESGYSPITSNWEDCKAAAVALGFSGDSVGFVDYMTQDYNFYQYNANVFNNKCYEEDNVVGGESITEITIQCTRTSQVAFLELWIADDGTKGVLDEEGDTAVIPNCCYPDAVPKGTPVTFYNIEIKCISQCQGQIY